MRVISLDGGGYLGLTPASFISGIEHHFDVACSSRFDLFCGTSTGAIQALALAIGMTGSELVSLYEELGPLVFPPRRGLLGLINNLRRAKYDNGPLKDTLESVFGDRTLGDLREAGRRVLIVAFGLTSGRPVIFKTDHSERLSGHDGYLLRDIALASSAAPTYFPIVPLTDPVTGIREVFCDGGMVANSPALLGYTEAIYELGVQASKVSILSLQTPRSGLAEPTSAISPTKRELDRGYIAWGLKPVRVALDGVSELSHQTLLRITSVSGAGYIRVPFSAPTGVGLDVVTAEATETLRQMGADRARDVGIRQQIEPFFTDE
jgi:hypothetical protein